MGDTAGAALRAIEPRQGAMKCWPGMALLVRWSAAMRADVGALLKRACLCCQRPRAATVNKGTTRAMTAASRVLGKGGWGWLHLSEVFTVQFSWKIAVLKCQSKSFATARKL